MLSTPQPLHKATTPPRCIMSCHMQDMGHQLDAAAPVQRRKHWDEIASSVVSSAYSGEESGVAAESLPVPSATSKVWQHGDIAAEGQH